MLLLFGSLPVNHGDDYLKQFVSGLLFRNHRFCGGPAERFGGAEHRPERGVGKRGAGAEGSENLTALARKGDGVILPEFFQFRRRVAQLPFGNGLS